MLKNITNKTFYIDSINGCDENVGTHVNCPWKTLNKLALYHINDPLGPGDKILLKSGSVFTDTVMFKNLHGTKDNPIR